jgi:hypothetical protein
MEYEENNGQTEYPSTFVPSLVAVGQLYNYIMHHNNDTRNM